MSESSRQESVFDSEDDLESMDDHLHQDTILGKKSCDGADEEHPPDTRYASKTIINIDSISRNTQPTLSYQKVKTYETWLYAKDHKLFVVLSNPQELPNSSMYSNTQSYGEKKIPSTIIGFIRWVSDKKEDTAPYSVAGIPASEILFNSDTKEPQLKLNLYKYSEDEDEAYYTVENVVPQKDEALGLDSEKGQSYQFYIITDRTEFYKNSNHFKVALGKSFQNVVKIKLISSEVPVPLNRDTHPYSKSSSVISIPGRNLEIPYENVKMDDSSVETAIIQGASHGDVVSLNIPKIGGSKSSMKVFFLQTNQDSIDHIEDHFIDMRYSDRYQPGKLIWLNLKDTFQQYNHRLMMVQISYEYKCILEPRTVPFPVSDRYSKVYLDPVDQDHTAIGYVTKVDSSSSKNTIYFSSENANLGNELLGKILFISKPTSNGTIISLQRLGPSSFIHIQPVFDHPIEPSYSTNIKAGVFIEESFSVECGEDSDHPWKPEETHEIIGNMEHQNNGQTKLSFLNDEIPYSEEGYQIHSIEDQDHEQSNMISRNIHGIEHSTDDTVIINTDDQPVDLNEGDFCRVNLNNRSEWCDVLSIDGNRIELNTPWNDDFNAVDQLFVKDRGLSIAKGDHCENISTGVLRRGVETGDFHIDVLGTYPIEKSWIIVIQPTGIDNNSQKELNVVHDVSRDVSDTSKQTLDALGQIDSLEQLVTLRFPIQQEIEQGATIRQTYLFLEIYPREAFHSSTIRVSSNIKLDKKLPNHCVGCVNWMSSVLLEKGGQTFWASEEPIIVENVSHIKHDIYELSVSPPLEHHYPWDSYIVLFVDTEMSRCEPSSINFKEQDNWRTAFKLEPSQYSSGLIDSFPQGVYRIEGMIGENIPIHGLSRSDEIARSLILQQNKDKLGKDDIDTPQLSHPNITDDCRTVSTVPQRISNYMDQLSTPYIIFEGRYGGRGGSIIHIPNQTRAIANVEHLSWYNHQSCPKTRVSSISIESSRLPRSLHKSSLVNIRVSPKDTSKNPSKNTSNSDGLVYSYFFLCTPYLDNLETVTRVLQKPNTNSSSSMEAPQMDKLGIFAKIQCKYKKDQGIMYNTFIETDNELPGVAIDDDFEWIFLWPDGREVDFGNRNVSFTIEITESLRILS